MTSRRITTYAAFALAAVVATLLAAIISALAFTASALSGVQGSADRPEVQQLPRVVVTGSVQRTPVAGVIELPRVVVTGRPVGATPTLVTEAERAAAPRS